MQLQQRTRALQHDGYMALLQVRKPSVQRGDTAEDIECDDLKDGVFHGREPTVLKDTEEPHSNDMNTTSDYPHQERVPARVDEAVHTLQTCQHLFDLFG